MHDACGIANTLVNKESVTHDPYHAAIPPCTIQHIGRPLSPIRQESGRLVELLRI
jgi:hypothetical protein